MKLQSNRPLFEDCVADKKSGPCIGKYVLHGARALFEDLPAGTFFQIVARGGAVIETELGNISIQPGERAFFFSFWANQFSIKKYKGLTEIFYIGFPEEWIQNAICDNSSLLGQVPNPTKGVHRLATGSAW